MKLDSMFSTYPFLEHSHAYLMFNGNCEEAMNFYKSVLGGYFETVNYFKDGKMEVQPEMGNKIMHIEFRTGDAIILGSD